MKIGIDAKWFFNGPPSGKVVVKQLLKELLSDTYRNHEFYIFLNKNDKDITFPYKRSNVKLVYVNSFNNLISNAIILPKYSKKLNLDIVVFQNFGTFFRIKNLVYIHDLLYLDYPEFYTFKERVYLSLLKPLAKKANTIVTISKTEKNRIIKHNLGTNNVSFVHHGVDQKFKPLSQHNKGKIERLKEKYNLPDQFILYLGRLNVRKNISNLIVAMQFVDLPLVIVGKPDHKIENLTTTINKLNLNKKINFTGFIEEEELPIIYALATVFCFPSYAEGFGLPPLEAMASGTPVVVSDRTSLPEVCEDAALYVNPDDPKDIAQKINSLLASMEIIDIFVNKGLNHSSKFTWKKATKSLMEIITKTNDSQTDL